MRLLFGLLTPCPLTQFLCPAGKFDSSSSSYSAERTKPPQHSQPQSQQKKKGVPPHIRVTPSKHEVAGIIQPTEESILEDVVQATPQPPIAALSHGLDRVLFNPGVHWVQDPRSRVYNFTPWLQSVPSVDDFDFNRIPQFVPSSRDDALFSLAKKQGRRFAGSTSSLTGILGQCYFLISGEKEVDTSVLSEEFRNKVCGGLRLPYDKKLLTSAFLSPRRSPRRRGGRLPSN